MMQSSLPAPTADQQRRFDVIQQLGCICCWMRSRLWHTPGEIHHLIDGGRRVSHWDTVCLCAWHHRGVNDTTHKLKKVRKAKGPSLAHEPQAFRLAFGADADLLEFQNRAAKLYQVNSGLRKHLGRLVK